MLVRHSPSTTAIRAAAHVIDESPRDYDLLLRMVGDRPFVLLGEATHGTHEFYAMRAQITQRLISELEFDAVAVEADWPDAYRLNRYVTDLVGGTLDDAFADFQRFPTWMWRNHDVRAFIDWLHAHNAPLQADRRAGFYGMDLYSLYRSADEVIAYLQSVDPDQAAIARRLYACLDHVRDPQDYGAEASSGLRPPCRDAAAALLIDLVRKGSLYESNDGQAARDEHFFAERNAYVVLNAEHYYRAMFGSRINTWNLRDGHMVDTLLALRRHLRASGRAGRIVVWAHNSHLGDARATQMGERGEWNVGQLLREQVGESQTLAVGFTTYTGHVTAARDWDQPAERRWIRPAHPDSYEHLLYSSRLDRFFLPLTDGIAKSMAEPLLERAIGVVYRPESEMESHYFGASLSAQFDAVFHLDETTAVEPFDITEHWVQHEPADTYPFGL
ncbi:erythromycin esterase family protein [Lysobacter niabensis]|uniref:erythromycin esterase family protein n=1 Tax=Agrilutibacter niabensis TaxID=380628 RepID=UPI00360F87D5